MSYLKSSTSLIRRDSDAHMQKSSHFHVAAQGDTHTHAHANTLPSSKSVFSTAHFLPPLLKNDSGRYFHSLGRKKSRYIELSHKIGFKLYCSVKAASTSSYQT